MRRHTSRKALEHAYPDLWEAPPGRSAWDCTLAALAYGMRIDLPGATPDLNRWAAHHGVPASARFADLGDDAVVLWHGTSGRRADKIVAHGLFHKRGLWTAKHPKIPYRFCRHRSTQFGTEGAVICIVLSRQDIVPGKTCEIEPNENVVRFHHGLPPDVVEYVIRPDEVRFVGTRRVAVPAAWPRTRFKHESGRWIPVRQPPVRFSRSCSFRSLEDYVDICLRRLSDDLGFASPLEILSVLFALVRPWDALSRPDLLERLETRRSRDSGQWRVFA